MVPPIAMNILMGILLILAGAFLVIQNRDLVRHFTGGSHALRDSDASISRENRLIIGAMMLLTGVGFFTL